MDCVIFVVVSAVIVDLVVVAVGCVLWGLL